MRQARASLPVLIPRGMAAITPRLIDRGRSSVGRAPEWHSGGQGFDSPRLHHPIFPCPPIALSPLRAYRSRASQSVDFAAFLSLRQVYPPARSRMAFRWAEPIKCYSGSIALPVRLTAQLSPTRGVGETANPSRKTISALYSTLPDVAGCSALPQDSRPLRHTPPFAAAPLRSYPAENPKGLTFEKTGSG